MDPKQIIAELELINSRLVTSRKQTEDELRAGARDIDYSYGAMCGNSSMTQLDINALIRRITRES